MKTGSKGKKGGAMQQMAMPPGQFGQPGMGGMLPTAGMSRGQPGMVGNVNASKNVSGKINNKNIKNKGNKNNANNSGNNANNADNSTAEGLLEINIASYKNIIIVLIIILLLFIIGYFVSFSYREGKGLHNLSTVNEYIFIDSKVNTRAHRDKKLCDFFIAGAYRPYMVINQRFDYCSLEMLKSVLLMGVRAVYLDIFNSSLNENAYPIVTTGIKKVNGNLD